jgi:hypothetical protein
MGSLNIYYHRAELRLDLRCDCEAGRPARRRCRHQVKDEER